VLQTAGYNGLQVEIVIFSRTIFRMTSR